MNQYSFLIGDLSALTNDEKKLACRIFGYMALGSANGMFSHEQGANSIPPTEFVATAQMPFRLPSFLDVDTIGVELAGKGYAVRSVTDQQSTVELNNMERAIVNQGDFVCALVDKSKSINDQLLNAVEFSLIGGLKFVCGRASQTAEQGVYQTPFSQADAFVNFGSLTSVQGLVNNGTPLPPVQLPTAPVAGGINRATTKAAQ